MSYFFEEFKDKENEIKVARYSLPQNNLAFINRNFEKVKWGRSKERNFSIILKVLAEKGPCTIPQILDNDPVVDRYNRNSRGRTLHRLLNGNKRNNVEGIIKKGFVEKETNNKSATYGLTLFGIFLVTKLFNFVHADFYSNKKYNNQRKIFEHNYTTALQFLNTLSNNYSKKLPLVFGKWQQLMKQGVDFRTFSNIPIFYKFDYGDPLFSSANFLDTFSTYDKQITAFFYDGVLRKYSFITKHKNKFSFDSDINNFIKTWLEYKCQFFTHEMKHSVKEYKLFSKKKS